MAAKREDIFSDMFPIVLHSLKPSQREGESLEIQPVPEVETCVWIDENVVHESPDLTGIREMIHISGISQT